ncbi:MAG: hypothetical protein EA363_00490 [Balneolaceae bacterium]|nr:MAG: hypothetical protein EA363_00490 [Balneolaceae bacterium]
MFINIFEAEDPEGMVSKRNYSGQIIGLQPDDILTGIGSADRRLLATLIALFEDSKLSKRIKGKSGELLSNINNVWNKYSGKETSLDDVRSEPWLAEKLLTVESKLKYWLDEKKFSDDDLRLIIWIYLRDALKLDPVLPLSQRSLKRHAGQIVAATVHVYDPPKFSDKVNKIFSREIDRVSDPKVTLDDIVVPVLTEMMKAAFSEKSGMDEESKKRLYDEIRANLTDLDEDEQSQILDSIGSKEFNDAAIRNVLLTGGGLFAFGSAVNIAGFSAYILAAKASAFIPLVSGPALVSFVSVLSNPVTMIGGTAAAALWASNKADSSIKAALAIRVVALLTLQGLSNRDHLGIYKDKVLSGFLGVDRLKEFGELSDKIISVYRNQWRAAGKKMKLPPPRVNQNVSDLMDQPIEALYPYLEKKSELKAELHKTAWVTGLTIGDITYSLAAIDPTVMDAADFSRVADLGDRLPFAEFSLVISQMVPSSHLGAVSNLKGYVAEHVVAQQLVLQGHEVDLAGTSNEAGWDILVDGEKFQIKSLASSGGIRTHFNQYDYPVIANSELQGQIPPDLEDKVFFVDGFSDEVVSHVTQRSLSHGADAFEPDVPLYAIGVSTAFVIRDYRTGKLRSDQAMEQVLMDGGTRVGLATMGGFLGSGIGLVVYGPAGALIWGALMPILAQSQTTFVKNRVHGIVKTKELLEWESNLKETTDQLIEKILITLNEKIERLRNKFREFGLGIISDYIKRRVTDDGRYLHEMKMEIKAIRDNTKLSAEDKAIKTLRFLAHSTIHPVKYQDELVAIQKILSEKPSLVQSGKRWYDERMRKD